MNHNVVNEIHNEVIELIKLGFNPNQIRSVMEYEHFYTSTVEESNNNGQWVRFHDEYSETSTLTFLPNQEENHHE